MIRSLLVVVMMFVGPGLAFSQEGAAAKQAFDQTRQEWLDLIVRHGKAAQQQGGAEVEQLQKQLEQMIDKIVAAGLNVYRAGVHDDPMVNQTMVAIAGFYLTGDSNGDGGDQYEKAAAMIGPMLDAGLGDQSPRLWMWSGVSAYCTNNFDLAEKHLQKAQQAGLLQGGQRGADPIASFATNCLNSLPKMRAAWQKEQKIRAAEAEADDLPRVKFQTSRGDVVIELFENEAPQAVANFITLVKKGFYNGIVFHRVLPQFMAQGGDPTGTGSGGPGYQIRCECYGDDLRQHFRGSMSMAHAGRDTGGSQFFLTFVPTSYLDGKHTVFGRVIEGMENAAAIKRRDPGSPSSPTPDKIVKATVLRDRGHAYSFEKLPGR